jgi:hypothetical protein
MAAWINSTGPSLSNQPHAMVIGTAFAEVAARRAGHRPCRHRVAAAHRSETDAPAESVSVGRAQGVGPALECPSHSMSFRAYWPKG